MNLRSLIATSTLVALLIPTVTFAARPVVKKYLEVEGPFETEEEAEAACMEAVGINEESIRFSTGNIGYLWEVENPLRFYVRRCLTNIKKMEENRRLGEQKEQRKQTHKERVLYPKTLQRIEASDQSVQDRTRDNVRSRASQHIHGRSKNIETYEKIRSLSRVDIHSKEREIRAKLEEKKSFEKEAEKVCHYKRGAQRVMCIRQEVREREEALYENTEAEE